MKLNQQTIEQLAEHLENAELQAFEVVKITEAHPDMDWDDAYAIQAEILRRKLARGNRVVGLKAGLTSRGNPSTRLPSSSAVTCSTLRVLFSMASEA